MNANEEELEDGWISAETEKKGQKEGDGPKDIDEAVEIDSDGGEAKDIDDEPAA